MNAQSISRDVALRIGLAVRVLPGIQAAQLLEVLKERIGFPLTEARLSKMTVTDLKTGLASLDGEEGFGVLKIALEINSNKYAILDSVNN